MNQCFHEKNGKSPIKVLFISHECRRQHYTEQTEYALWYEGALAFHGGNRVKVGIAYDANASEAYDQADATGFPANSSIQYFPLNVDLSYGAIGAAWDQACCALVDVVAQFKPDIIHCFGSEWPHGAIAEVVDAPVVVHMMGFLNAYYPAIDIANGYSCEDAAKHRQKWIFQLKKRHHDNIQTKKEANAAFERRVMKANRYFLGRTEWDRNIVKRYSPGSRYFHAAEFIRLPFIQNAGSWNYHFDGKLRLITVSSLDERKGIEIILRCAKLLKEEVGIDFEWRVAGSTDFFARFESRCGICHDDVNVRMLGMLETQAIIEELKRADFFVHPSIIDNSPRSICEAQLIGCPVLASNVGGVPQLVEDGVTGFLYPYNEPLALSFLMANLLDQRDKLTEISRTASRISRERHDPQAIANRILDVYGEIVTTYEK